MYDFDDTMFEKVDEDVIFTLLSFFHIFKYAFRTNLIIFSIFCDDYWPVQIHHLAVLLKNRGLSENELKY